MRNTSSSISHDQQMRPLSAITLLHRWNVDDTDAPAIIDAKARYWLKIVIFATVRAPRQNTAIRFSTEKLEWCG